MTNTSILTSHAFGTRLPGAVRQRAPRPRRGDVIGRALPAGPSVAGVLATIDRRFVLHAALWAVASLLAFGLVAAIIPNPVFGREVPPQPFAIVVWFAFAPLMGLLSSAAHPRRSLPHVIDLTPPLEVRTPFSSVSACIYRLGVAR